MQLCPGTEIFRPVYSRLLLNSVMNISSHLQSQIFRILKMANQKNPPKTTNQPTTYYFSGEFKACKIIATDIWNVPTLQVYSKPLKVYRKENKECWREQAEDAGLGICTAASGGQDYLFFPKIIEKLQ